MTVPGLGDDIQAIKAGLLEVADLFVVNKADREGVERTVKDIRVLQSLVKGGDWTPPVVRTVAIRGEGVPAVTEAIHAHREHRAASVDATARDRARQRHILLGLVRDVVMRSAEAAVDAEGEALLNALIAHQTDPYSEADRFAEALLSPSSS